MSKCPICDQSVARSASQCPSCGAPVSVPPAGENEYENEKENDLDEQLLSLLKQGRKVEAVRLYRKSMDCNLMTAKEAVEALAAKHGITAQSSGCMSAIVIAVVLAAAGAAVVC